MDHPPPTIVSRVRLAGAAATKVARVFQKSVFRKSPTVITENRYERYLSFVRFQITITLSVDEVVAPRGRGIYQRRPGFPGRLFTFRAIFNRHHGFCVQSWLKASNSSVTMRF